MMPRPLARASGVATRPLTIATSWNVASGSRPFTFRDDDIGGLAGIGDGVLPALQRGLDERLHLRGIGLDVIFASDDAVAVERQAVVGQQENLRVLHAHGFHHGRHRRRGCLDCRNFPGRQHVEARRRIDVGVFHRLGLEPCRLHEGFDHLAAAGARAAADLLVLKLLRAWRRWRRSATRRWRTETSARSPRPFSRSPRLARAATRLTTSDKANCAAFNSTPWSACAGPWPGTMVTSSPALL